MAKITPNHPNIPFPVGAVEIDEWDAPEMTVHPYTSRY
jgi:hypothetical protein